MAELNILADKLQERFNNQISAIAIENDEITIEVLPENLREMCEVLRTHPDFSFEMLMDICGVDYLYYGISEWETSEQATFTGFSRGVERLGTKEQSISESDMQKVKWHKPRFATVYHLLSLSQNHRLRIRCLIEGEPPIVPSLINIWNSANWYEREAFDLFGIYFDEHPDLRRILTDYGFIGYPFRKDFPVIGTVEMRYSAKDKRVIYEPVQIKPRTLTPKVIPMDNRYLDESHV